MASFSGHRDEYGQLRNSLDSNDPFMTGGHQIHIKRSKRRRIPEWAKSDSEVQKLLLRSFPKLATDDLQRRRAGRWARVIHLYFRSLHTWSEIAEELGEKPNTIHRLIASIFRAGRGQRARNGRARSGVPIGTSFGGQTETVAEPISGRS